MKLSLTSLWKTIFWQKRLQNSLDRHQLSIAIVNPTPKPSDKHGWEWYQREAVWKGRPFSYRVGPFFFQVPTFSYDELHSFLEKAKRLDPPRLLASVSKPVGKYSKLLSFHITLHKLLRCHVAAESFGGVFSELLYYMTAVKKKMWAIESNGITRHGEKAPLTNLQKMQFVEKSPVLRKVGAEIFGTTMS